MNNKEKRRQDLICFIRRRSGRRFLVSVLSKELGVSERTVKSDLAFLENEKQIRRQPSYNVEHRQNGNIIVFTGARKRQSRKADDGWTCNLYELFRGESNLPQKGLF